MSPYKEGYTFSPDYRDYFNVAVDQLGEDYVTTLNTYAITGNAGIAGATITYDGGATTTDGDGNYSFTVDTSWSGTATPSMTGYKFKPANRDYSNVIADSVEQNYTAVKGLPPQTGARYSVRKSRTSVKYVFTFRSSKPASRFMCKLDDGEYSACSRSKTYSNLAIGQHTFYVYAIDRAGYADPTPTSITFTVSAPTPGRRR